MNRQGAVSRGRADVAWSSVLTLASPTTAALFEVSPDDWTAISKRVGYTARLREIAGPVAEHLPDFPSLLAACEAWRSATFPAIVAAAGDLSSYSQRARQDFAVIQASWSAADPVPPELPATVAAALQALAARTATLCERFDDLAVPVARFHEVNAAVDANLDRFTQSLGPDWRSILPSTTTVQDATGRVRGAWAALTDDLDALARQHIDVTVPFLASLQIGSALTAWAGVDAEADAFTRIASDQDRYLTGQWLGQ